MARILFLQRIWTENLGPMVLSSALKRSGHISHLIVESGRERNRDIRRFKPDLIAFSVTTGTHGWALRRAAELKRLFSIPIIMGGPHATYYPEVIQANGLDYICRGEGEQALTALCDRLDEGHDVTGIPNLWIKTDDGIEQNPLGDLIGDLDSLPFPDRSLYYKYKFFRNNENKSFISGRGCPYSCRYCSIAGLRKLYEEKGAFVRFHSPEYVIEEIHRVRSTYGLKSVIFQDDTFILGTERLAALLDLYARRIRLPFVCHIRADLVTPEIARMLKEAGCHSVDFGLESGDPELRQTVLGKPISDDRIREAAAHLHEAGIRFRTTNMFGLPGETPEMAWKTVALNQEIRTDYPSASLYQPYPRTDLGDEVIARGLAGDDYTVDDIGSTFLRNSILNLEHRNVFINLQKLFWPAVRYPGLEPLIRRLIKLPANPLFEFLFLFFYAVNYTLSEKVTVKRVLNLGFHTARTVFFGRL